MLRLLSRACVSVLSHAFSQSLLISKSMTQVANEIAQESIHLHLLVQNRNEGSLKCKSGGRPQEQAMTGSDNPCHLYGKDRSLSTG